MFRSQNIKNSILVLAPLKAQLFMHIKQAQCGPFKTDDNCAFREKAEIDLYARFTRRKLNFLDKQDRSG